MKRRDFLKGLLGASMAGLAPEIVLGETTAKPKQDFISAFSEEIEKEYSKVSVLRDGEIGSINGVRIIETIEPYPKYSGYLVRHEFKAKDTTWSAATIISDLDDHSIVEHARATNKAALMKAIDNG